MHDASTAAPAHQPNADTGRRTAIALHSLHKRHLPGGHPCAAVWARLLPARFPRAAGHSFAGPQWRLRSQDQERQVRLQRLQ